MLLLIKLQLKLGINSLLSKKAKELDNEEFLEKFKADKVPFDGDEQFVIKLKKAAQYKDKTQETLYQSLSNTFPRVFLSDGEGNLEDITFDRLVGMVVLVQFNSKPIQMTSVHLLNYKLFELMI